MGYCVVADIQALIPTQVWNSAATAPIPTAAQTLDFAEDVSAEIDAKLAGRYATPITGATALSVVNSIAARLCAIRVWGVIFTGSAGIRDYPKDWDLALKLLDELANGKAALSDAAALAAGSENAPGPPAMTMRELRADPLQDEVMDPVFTERQVW